MLIHYFQVEKLIAFTLVTISSLHSFDIHIKFITYKCINEVGF